MWTNQYFTNLPLEINKFKNRGLLNLGNMVLIREDNVPRMKWPFGVIDKLHKGGDGNLRSVDVKTPQGVKSRAIQRVHPLEICDT